MNIERIRNDADLKAAFAQLVKCFQAAEGTLAAGDRDVLVTWIEAFVNKHCAFGPADPVEAIMFRMEQPGLTATDLEACIGSNRRVSKVLNRKRPLSLWMVKRLHEELTIPRERLMPGVA